MLDPLYYLMFSTNEKISITQIEGNWPQSAFREKKDREKLQDLDLGYVAEALEKRGIYADSNRSTNASK
jgi:hypothetical protein